MININKKNKLFEVNKSSTDAIKSILFRDRFIVPPFSVLDTKQGYWQERKGLWEKITGNLSETRNEDFGIIGGKNSMLTKINDGTSNFDPVLAEIIYYWFCTAGGKILDPFGGEQTKGVVAGVLGYNYVGCEIRQEQVDLNREKVKDFPSCKYYCGDSNDIDKIIPDRDFDMCFTSPPYYDLEVYSKEDMSALGTYEEFMQQYKNIFAKCYSMLKDDTFLVVKVAEIRNKKTGIYRGFVPDNIKVMEEIGFKYYNELILVNAIGTLPLRAGKIFNTSRKVGKQHQNILVFYKGNPDNIKKKFKELNLGIE